MRALLVLLTVLALAVALAGCGGGDGSAGGKETSSLQRFVSRPDLRPTRVEIRTSAENHARGYVFVGPKKIGGPGGLMILDHAGKLVWYKPLAFPVQPAGFRVQRYRGRPVLTWWQGDQPTTGIGTGEYVIADRSYRTIATVRAGNGLQGDLHEFLLTPHGTAYITAYRKRPADLSGIGGPREGWVFDSVVQEIDVASGRVLFEWHSVDHVEPRESPQRIPARKASKKTPFDYFHINSVDVDADGNLLVSARNTSAIYKIRRRDGEIMWRLGGTASDFKMGAGTRFAWQHDARRQRDGTITVFDNSAMPKVADHSRALVLHVDERTHEARLVRAYSHPTKVSSPHQGSVQRLPNGDVFVGWGGAPLFTEFSPTGTVLFDAKLIVGDTYRAERFPWSGRPVDPPDVRAAKDEDDVTLHVSWNGATDVVKWRVFAGSDRSDLRPVAARAKTGFETRLVFSTDARFLMVEGLDRLGHVLGRSRVVQPSG